MSIIILLVVYGVTGIYFFQKIRHANTEICKYIESKYSGEWQDFLVRGRQMGSTEKWAKQLAISSIKDGKLTEKNDAKFSQYLENQKRLQFRLIITPILIMLVFQLINAFI